MAHAGGRPLKFQSTLELQTRVDAYFARCDPHIEEVTEWLPARDGKGKLKKDKYGLSYLVEVTHNVLTKQEPYGIVALALALGTTRDVITDYESGKYDGKEVDPGAAEEFSFIIKEAKTRVQAYIERNLHGTTPTGSIFMLKANFKWRDNDIDTTPPTDNPINFLNKVA